MKNAVSWGVVGTMDEPAPLILAWVAHHLAAGAAEAHVYLDQPNPTAEAALRDIAGCTVTLCDDAYWAASSRKARPPRHTARQKYNATQVYQTRPLDWVLHCDADEFLDITGDFTAELATSTARTLRLRNFERVRRDDSDMLFAGSFRGQLNNTKKQTEIYNRWAAFLSSGMAGYQDGKDIVRSGENFTMGVHFPIDAATAMRHTEPYVELKSARLLHFDGLTPLHITTKLLKRATEPVYQIPRKFGVQREKQFKFAINHVAKPKQLKQMLAGVFSVNATQASALGATHLNMAFDPRKALAELGLTPDLTATAFDAELAEREADLIAQTGLLW